MCLLTPSSGFIARRDYEATRRNVPGSFIFILCSLYHYLQGIAFIFEKLIATQLTYLLRGAAVLVELWPPHILYVRFHDNEFLQGGVVSPTPNPQPGGIITRLVNKVSCFYETRNCITKLTRRYLCQMNAVQNLIPYLCTTLILSSHLRVTLQSGIICSGIFDYVNVIISHACYIPLLSHHLS
jgi:hypothetical protein